MHRLFAPCSLKGVCPSIEAVRRDGGDLGVGLFDQHASRPLWHSHQYLADTRQIPTQRFHGPRKREQPASRVEVVV